MEVHAAAVTLPSVEEPLRLADGSLVFPDGSVKTVKQLEREQQRAGRLVAVPSSTDAIQTVMRTNRKLSDLPAVPKTMNGVSVVLTYTLFGLADEEIAIATGLTIAQIKRMREHDVYVQMQKSVLEAVRKQDSENVRNIFVQKSSRAAEVVDSLMESDNELVALKAAGDILDRAGHRPADVVEHRMSIDNTLRIEIVKRDATKSNAIPELELEATEIDDADSS